MRFGGRWKHSRAFGVSIARALTTGKTSNMQRYLIVMLIAAMATGAATAAQAKKAKKHRHAVRPYAVYVQPSAYGFMRQGGIVYSSTGSVVPAYVLSTPNKCWVEDGYNRWSSCDAIGSR
jgi:hypothetical protein